MRAAFRLFVSSCSGEGHKAVPYSCGFGTQSSSLQLWVWDTKQFLTVVGLGHKAVPYSCGFGIQSSSLQLLVWTQSSSLQLWDWDTKQPLTFVSLGQKQFLTFVGLGHKAVPYSCVFGTQSSSLQLCVWDTNSLLHLHSTLTSTVFFCRKQPLRQQTARASRVAEPVIHYTETKVENTRFRLCSPQQLCLVCTDAQAMLHSVG